MSSKSGGAKASRKEEGIKVISDNRRARYDYEILQTFEAGIELKGSEVKSLRTGHTNLAEAYAAMKGGELWLINSNIPEYREANRFNHEPKRPRKLLLHKSEIDKLSAGVLQEHLTIIPLKMFFNQRGRVKVDHRAGPRQEAARQARDHQGTLMGPRARPPDAGQGLSMVFMQHLVGRRMPDVDLEATSGSPVNPAQDPRARGDLLLSLHGTARPCRSAELGPYPRRPWIDPASAGLFKDLRPLPQARREALRPEPAGHRMAARFRQAQQRSPSACCRTGAGLLQSAWACRCSRPAAWTICSA